MGQAREVVDRFWEITESQQLDRLGEVLTDDCEFTMPGVSLRGVEQMTELCRNWWTSFPDLRHNVRDVVESDTKLVYEITMIGTHEAPMQTPAGELPATGKRVEMPSCDVIMIRDGKIATFHAYPDMMGLLAQLGAVAPAA